jgi:hypothetical protein
MKSELERRADRAHGEPTSMSRIVRQAIRDYFKRHPLPGSEATKR